MATVVQVIRPRYNDRAFPHSGHRNRSLAESANFLLVGLSTMVAYLIAMVAWMRRHARLAQAAANEIDTSTESAIR